VKGIKLIGPAQDFELANSRWIGGPSTSCLGDSAPQAAVPLARSPTITQQQRGRVLTVSNSPSTQPMTASPAREVGRTSPRPWAKIASHASIALQVVGVIPPFLGIHPVLIAQAKLLTENEGIAAKETCNEVVHLTQRHHHEGIAAKETCNEVVHLTQRHHHSCRIFANGSCPDMHP